MTKEEFAKRIKSKYPDYRDVDDIELADRMLQKHPDYREQISESTSEPLKASVGGNLFDLFQSQGSATASGFPISGGIPSPTVDIGPSLPRQALSGFTRTPIPGVEPTLAGGAARYVGQEALPTFGAALGTSLGPLGIGGGAAAFRTLQEGLSAGLGAFKPDVAHPRGLGEVLKAGIETGVISAALPGAVAAGGALKQAIGKKAAQVGGQLIRVATGVPAKTGEAALRGGLQGAPKVDEAGQLYDIWAKASGLESLDEALPKLTGKIIPDPSDFQGIVNTAYQKLQGNALTLQEALHASQAVNKLENLAKLGRSEYAGARMQLGMAKKAFDDFIETQAPGFQKVRELYAKGKVREAFSHILPQNVTGTPNVLRPMLAAGAATSAVLGGASPASLTLLPLMSPAFVGAGIRAGGALASGVSGAAPYAGPSLENIYRRFQAQPR